MLDERGGISPFGWAIACVGQPPERVEQDVAALVAWSTREWKRHFPAERGYVLCIEAPDNPAAGIHMTAQRGDFSAEVTIEHEDPRLRGSGATSAMPARPSVRAYGRAQSDVLHRAHLWGERAISRGRLIGSIGGISLFVMLAWLMIGVSDPIYVLGGMLLVVALLLTLMAGGTLGTWFGERLARHRHTAARQQLGRDVGIDDDMRRWKAVARKLASQRSLLQRRRGQPFRSDPRVLANESTDVPDDARGQASGRSLGSAAIGRMRAVGAR